MDDHDGALSWLYGHILQEQFASDSGCMARCLGVSETTLRAALCNPKSDAVLLIFEPLVRFCSANHLNINAMLEQYLSGEETK